MSTHSALSDDGYGHATEGRGCLSGFAIPPLVILAIGGLFVSIAFAAPTPEADAGVPQPAAAGVSPIFTPEVQFWSPVILDWASSEGLDPNLIAVIMQIESCGDPFARSRAGAIGLFQVMPYHFVAADDPYSPDVNAKRGLAYLKRSLAAANNDIRLALAGYNGGISLISVADWAWPSETIRYAYWGTGIYSDAMDGSASSPRLAEWMAAGGSSLCRAAAQRLQIGN